ncbi:6-phosphogluconolactonase SOL4 Ecym_5572 [Eremothecium cymbalariae DBVPG|uniref:6-phosphogluconolactonase-like protein n=1 Tax=Eremothecium cymbalariae (strain CBS 270.75 / DBVPG 7215 / KCTC 17166 / NRRL Y-17582) TaxID=931890 RepID=I6NE18_ERECY|nr:hypothetical protein Ecym_5572 [Eremothecium cymbalariae DBVPG\
MVNVYQYSESQDLAHWLGQYIVDVQNDVLNKKNGGTGSSFNIAVSGGSLIKVLERALLQDAEIAPQVQWSKWNVYFCDERLVSLEHPDSNFGAFKKYVLEPLASSGSHILPTVYTINESLLEKGTKEYIAEDYSTLLPEGAILDLILLGCGPDGHTCSLFPGKQHRYLLEDRDRPVAWCKNSPKPPSDRITFTMPVLEKATALAFVAEGSAKRNVLEMIFKQKDLTLPCSLVNHHCENKVSWFVNNEALEGLGVPTTTYPNKNSRDHLLSTRM